MSEKEMVTGNKELSTCENEFVFPADANVLEEMNEELKGLEFSFDKIKIPSGGSTAFEIPDGDTDEPIMVREISGVILLHHPAFTYYRDKYSGGSNPPDCGSFDGVTGTGEPGGSCASCRFNQFGSGDGQGKACKNRRMIYVLPKGELFPMVLSLPTGSLREFTKYVKHQLSKGRRLNQIVTKISLRKATNSSGIAFSQAVFTFDRVLNTEERSTMARMSESVRHYAANLSVAELAESEDEISGEEVPFVDVETGEVLEPLRK